MEEREEKKWCKQKVGVQERFDGFMLEDKKKNTLQVHPKVLMFETDFNSNNETFVFSQTAPVKAAFLLPDAAAFGVDLVLGSTSAAHLVQRCKGTADGSTYDWQTASSWSANTERLKAHHPYWPFWAGGCV